MLLRPLDLGGIQSGGISGVSAGRRIRPMLYFNSHQASTNLSTLVYDHRRVTLI